MPPLSFVRSGRPLVHPLSGRCARHRCLAKSLSIWGEGGGLSACDRPIPHNTIQRSANNTIQYNSIQYNAMQCFTLSAISRSKNPSTVPRLSTSCARGSACEHTRGVGGGAGEEERREGGGREGEGVRKVR